MPMTDYYKKIRSSESITENQILEMRVRDGFVYRLKSLSSDWAPWTYQVDLTAENGLIGNWFNFDNERKAKNHFDMVSLPRKPI